MAAGLVVEEHQVGGDAISLDFQWLDDHGLGALSQDDKQSLLAAIYEELELRVGIRLSEARTSEQLAEFEALMAAGDEVGAKQWLDTNKPDYTEVAPAVLAEMGEELRSKAEEVLERRGVRTPRWVRCDDLQELVHVKVVAGRRVHVLQVCGLVAGPSSFQPLVEVGGPAFQSAAGSGSDGPLIWVQVLQRQRRKVTVGIHQLLDGPRTDLLPGSRSIRLFCGDRVVVHFESERGSRCAARRQPCRSQELRQA